MILCTIVAQEAVKLPAVLVEGQNNCLRGPYLIKKVKDGKIEDANFFPLVLFAWLETHTTQIRKENLFRHSL